jgi:hypothetical protein
MQRDRQNVDVGRCLQGASQGDRELTIAPLT